MPPGVSDGGCNSNTGTIPKMKKVQLTSNDAEEDENDSSLQLHHQPLNQKFELPDVTKLEEALQDTTNWRSFAESLVSFGETANFDEELCQYINETRIFPEMTPPTDSRSESPSRQVAVENPKNPEKMPDQSQVESRLSQIRDYIKVTTSMIDSLTPIKSSVSVELPKRAQKQHEKLSKMLLDLYDSETKLSKLLEDYKDREDNPSIIALTAARERELKRKVEESQLKLAQLQEHQASLLEMQQLVKERLVEAKKAKELLLDDEEENSGDSTPAQVLTSKNTEQLETEAEALKEKLLHLQSKKKCMDELVAELQVAEAVENERTVNLAEKKNTETDKMAQLKAMKAQLSHLKELMAKVEQVRSVAGGVEDEDEESDEACANLSKQWILLDKESELNEKNKATSSLSNARPTLEQIHAVTQELREQATLLRSTRDEIRSLKEPLMMKPNDSELDVKKVCENNSRERIIEIQQVPAQSQLDEVPQKDCGSLPIVNPEVKSEFNSRRNSNSHSSQISANINWPSPNMIGSNPPSVYGTPSSENLLEIGSQAAGVDSNYNGNINSWGFPVVSQLINVEGSTEFYRQLLLGSQSQQLQMMNVTLHQCTQAIFAQQREMQMMKSKMEEMQLQINMLQEQNARNGAQDNLNSNVKSHFSLSNAVP